jgi:DNA processing protein
VISEHAPGTLPTKGTFPRRNRIISGLADAVVIVEAPARSGALLTASWALEQGRECFFVPAAIDAPQSAGCLAWLRDYGGVARIVAGVPQLLEDLGLMPSAAFPARVPGRLLVPPSRPVRAPTAAARRVELSPREDRIARALLDGGTTADELVAMTGMPVAAVLAVSPRSRRPALRSAFGRTAWPDSSPSRTRAAPATRRRGPAADPAA